MVDGGWTGDPAQLHTLKLVSETQPPPGGPYYDQVWPGIAGHATGYGRVRLGTAGYG